MAWLLDTNVLSELRKPKVNAQVAAFIASTPLDELYVSVVSIAEIRYGIKNAPDVDRIQQLEQWLGTTVRPMFEGRIVSMSEEVLVRWRSLAIEGQRTGRTFSQPDLLLAATALEHDTRWLPGT